MKPRSQKSGNFMIAKVRFWGQESIKSILSVIPISILAKTEKLRVPPRKPGVGERNERSNIRV